MAKKGWVIARVPSGRDFKVFEEIETTKAISDLAGWRLRRGDGPNCYAPVEMRLVAKNQWTKKKRENRTERPFPCFPGYVFIQDPNPHHIAILAARGLIFGLVPDYPRADNGFEPGPLVLSQREIDVMRNRHEFQYDRETGSGHRVSKKPEAAMIPGYEYEAGDTVASVDPAWIGHKFLCLEVMDTSARVLQRMFGTEHEVVVPLDAIKKAS